MGKMVLTSVKIDDELFDQFKIEGVKRKFTFSKLVSAAMWLYLTDENIREQITLTSLRKDFNIQE